jgi:hypothetical protein
MTQNRLTKAALNCIVFLGRREGLDIIVASLAIWMIIIGCAFVAAELDAQAMGVMLAKCSLVAPMVLWFAWVITGLLHEGCEDILEKWRKPSQGIPCSVLPLMPDEPCRAILKASRLLRDPGCEAASARLLELLEAWGDSDLSKATVSRRKIAHALAVVEKMAEKASRLSAGDPGQVPETFRSALDWTSDLIEAELDQHNQAISDDVAQDLRVLQSQGSLS